MALTAIRANHLGVRNHPVEESGKLRVIAATLAQGAVAGDAGSTWEIGRLPPGKVRIFPHLSWYKVSALGASRVMGLGHGAYRSRADGTNASQEALNAGAFGAAIDVSAATDAKFPVTGGVFYDMWSADGITLYATITGGTIPAAATGEFCVVYSDMN